MSNKPKVEIRDVTPEWAREILEKHDKRIEEGSFRQRPRSHKAVQTYATDMKAGNWGVTGQGISFDEDGNLLDGQHRLAAVVLAGVTVRMLIMWDVPTQVSKHIRSQDVMDIGRKRMVAQQLAIDGFTYYAEVATTARLLCVVASGFWHRHPNSTQVITVANVYKNNILSMIDLLKQGGAAKTRTRGHVIAPLVLFKAVEPDIAEMFATEFVEMTNLKKHSPVLHFHRFLERIVASTGGTDFQIRAMSGMMSAIYSYANDKAVELVRGNQEHTEWFIKKCSNPLKQIRALTGVTGDAPKPEEPNANSTEKNPA